MSVETPRYTVVAIVLHWAIALGILGMIPLGWWMADAINEPASRAHAATAFQLHKSIGLTILALSLVRLGWRFTNRPPPLPEGMARWERLAAQATHIGFYTLMIALPLSGWVYVSTGYTQAGQPLAVPTFWFGMFQVPHLPIAGAEDALRKAAAAGVMSAHSALAWGAIVLAGLHVAAALKHQFHTKDGVLARMAPGLPDQVPVAPAEPGRAMMLSIGLVAVVAAALAALIAAVTPPQAAETPSAAPTLLESAADPRAPAPEATSSESAAAPPGPEAEAVAAPVATPAAAPAEPAAWRVDQGASSIGFSGTHAGNAFSGRFNRWTADIAFSPDALAASRVQVRVQTGSADAGDAQYTATLREGEWFGPAQFSEAVFDSQRFRALGGDRFEALGVLRIKDRSIPVTLPFQLTIAGDVATMTGTISLDRIAAGLGLASDPGADWVSQMITVTVRVRATRTP